MKRNLLCYRNDLERFWSMVMKAIGFKSSGINEQSKLNLIIDRIVTQIQQWQQRTLQADTPLFCANLFPSEFVLLCQCTVDGDTGDFWVPKCAWTCVSYPFPFYTLLCSVVCRYVTTMAHTTATNPAIFSSNTRNHTSLELLFNLTFFIEGATDFVNYFNNTNDSVTSIYYFIILLTSIVPTYLPSKAMGMASKLREVIPNILSITLTVIYYVHCKHLH